MRIICFIVAIFTVANALSQSYCGTNSLVLREVAQRTLRQETYSQVEVRNELTYLPIVAHVVLNDNSEDTFSEAKVLDQLCRLNRDFQNTTIQFYLKSINILKSTAANKNPLKEIELLRKTRTTDAINVFIVNKIILEEESEERTSLGYYDGNRDWVLVTRDQINDVSTVLTHEIGHFLGLLHPYHGWEESPWKAEFNGTPAPTFSPNGDFTELVDRSNCEDSGDFLCDTPADYFFAFYAVGCEYTEPTLDPKSNLVNPDEYNFMNSFVNLGCDRARYTFTESQINLMYSELKSTRRAYIQSNYLPENLAIDETTVLSNPNDRGNTLLYNNIALSWSEVFGATYYLVEIDRLPTFDISPIRKIVDTNTLIIKELQSNRKYFWRVRPYNQYITCTPFSEANAFTTSSEADTSQFPLIERIAFYPNPASDESRITLELQTKRIFTADLHLYDSQGNLLDNKQLQVTPGLFQYTWQADRFASGFYILQISTTEGIQILKFVIVN